MINGIQTFLDSVQRKEGMKLRIYELKAWRMFSFEKAEDRRSKNYRRVIGEF